MHVLYSKEEETVPDKAKFELFGKDLNVDRFVIARSKFAVGYKAAIKALNINEAYWKKSDKEFQKITASGRDTEEIEHESRKQTLKDLIEKCNATVKACEGWSFKSNPAAAQCAAISDYECLRAAKLAWISCKVSLHNIYAASQADGNNAWRTEYNKKRGACTKFSQTLPAMNQHLAKIFGNDLTIALAAEEL